MKNPYWDGKVPTPVKFGDRTVAGTAKYPQILPGRDSCRDGTEEAIPGEVLAYIRAVLTLHYRIVGDLPGQRQHAYSEAQSAPEAGSPSRLLAGLIVPHA
jgi:hypothetical protein